MNYRVKIDEFSQLFDSQLINAQRYGELGEYRAFLLEKNMKLAETLSKTDQLVQHSPTMQVAQTMTQNLQSEKVSQHESRKRDRKVAMNTSVPTIKYESMEYPMPNKKERVTISHNTYFIQI